MPGRAPQSTGSLSLKGRDASKGISLLLPSRDAWGSLVAEIPALANLLANRFWPGPLTMALTAREDLDPRLTVDGRVAVRWAVTRSQPVWPMPLARPHRDERQPGR